MNKTFERLKRLTIAFSIVALLSVSVVFTSAFAYGDKTGIDSAFNETKLQDDGVFGRFVQRRFKKKLDDIADHLRLTPEQRAQIRVIIENEVPVVRPIVLNGVAIHQQIKPLGRDGVYNSEQVQRLATAQAQNAKLLIIEKEKTKAQIFAVLTPEQRAEAEQMSDEIEAKIREKISEKLDMKF